MQNHLNLNSLAQRKELLVATAIRFIAKTNAEISWGAESRVCQGKIRVAAAIAAANDCTHTKLFGKSC
jgi:L-serine deaminase